MVANCKYLAICSPIFIITMVLSLKGKHQRIGKRTMSISRELSGMSHSSNYWTHCMPFQKLGSTLNVVMGLSVTSIQ